MILHGSLHSTDTAQILYAVFWYHKATFFETLTLSKKVVFHSTLVFMRYTSGGGGDGAGGDAWMGPKACG